MRKKLLHVDDDAQYLELVKSALEEEGLDLDYTGVPDFEGAKTVISEARPDLLILDLRRGQGDYPGQELLQEFWQNHFCPVLVYSAFAEDLPQHLKSVRSVVKGSNSKAQLMGGVRELLCVVDGIEALRAKVEEVSRAALVAIANAGGPWEPDVNHMVQLGSRRVSAMLDAAAPLPNWTPYLVPALGDAPLTADVLRIVAEPSAPESYRLLLTPSCDLAHGKVRNVIVAKCYSLEDPSVKSAVQLYASKWKVQVDGRAKKVKEPIRETHSRLKREVLSQGFRNGFLPLPSFGAGTIPLMFACMKDIESIPFSEIGPFGSQDPKHKYQRIASIDSPFREQVAWALMNTVARPGVPDRALDEWVSQLYPAHSSG